MEPHHLYEVFDSEEKDIFKYGISCDELQSDGSSPRANRQVDFLNRAVGWLRYFARILLTAIPGRKRAEEIESKYIEEYKNVHGRNPRGNVDKFH